jgi:hypothetical protein
MLQAVRPVVVGFLLWTAYDMALNVFGAKSTGWGSALTSGWDKILLIVLVFALLTMTKVNPVWLVAGAALFGLMVY